LLAPTPWAHPTSPAAIATQHKSEAIIAGEVL